MAAGPALLGIAALLAFALGSGGRRSGRNGGAAARRALGASAAEARRPGFVRADDPRGRVALGEVEQTRGRDTSPAVRARRDLCRVPASGLALSGSDAAEVLDAWVRCQGRTRSQVSALLDRIDERYRSAPEPEQMRYNDLRAVVSDALRTAEAQGLIVSGVVAPEAYDPELARRLGGPLARRLMRAHAEAPDTPREDVAHFQVAAGLEGTGLYTPETRSALQHFGIRSAPYSKLTGPSRYRAPRRRRPRRGCEAAA